ncbi:hypothetical protein BJ875DRAFT_465133 [Amylocarpus encephaloides]|uniref:Uncharacterized protein n=1 Tax=Amylocarpus encephaloides TaxID=45428 RepID=A0A9P7YHB3_9HELO|nr:hypothetical protein BJ875DRAFT_465133 [Amylocarpus encephaloides]
MPADSDQTSLYHLVLEHGDLGIHSMSITTDENATPSFIQMLDATSNDRVQYMVWVRQYQAPNYERARQGKTHTTFDFCCESSEVTIRRDISMTLETRLSLS